MPTTLPRTTITHTETVRRLLASGGKYFPVERGDARAVLLGLAAEGLRSLQDKEREDEYADAFREWFDSGEEAAWSTTYANGLERDPVYDEVPAPGATPSAEAAR